MELVKTLLVSIPKQFRWAARFETTVLNGTKMSTLPSGNYKPVRKTEGRSQLHLSYFKCQELDAKYSWAFKKMSSLLPL